MPSSSPTKISSVRGHRRRNYNPMGKWTLGGRRRWDCDRILAGLRSNSDQIMTDWTQSPTGSRPNSDQIVTEIDRLWPKSIDFDSLVSRSNGIDEYNSDRHRLQSNQQRGVVQPDTESDRIEACWRPDCDWHQRCRAREWDEHAAGECVMYNRLNIHRL